MSVTWTVRFGLLINLHSFLARLHSRLPPQRTSPPSKDPSSNGFLCAMLRGFMTSDPVTPMGVRSSVKVCNILLMANRMAMRGSYHGEGGRLRDHSVGMVPVRSRPECAKIVSELNGNIRLACLDNIRTWGYQTCPMSPRPASPRVSYSLLLPRPATSVWLGWYASAWL
ncbi:hypothetical protein QBC32DRAFT_126001 [Pseudoneurospora amorphoporcata]|uniref:Uncharacterized protein n=1 Tax=Pseudoneurospora amorphoporcata TaxID=241081 RepID=A0AAN6SHF7_9PEZI|nr:hypothetical protein QBC32DRAFT_126001 [Pseudoneurospora amorphoporcata]